MTQLLLDLGPAPAPSFDNFVAGDNAEALAALRALAAGTPGAARFVYLWGPAGSGRSHLLNAAAAAAAAAGIPARLLGPASPRDGFDHDASVRLWLVDDCDRLDAARQAAAFHLFDAVQAHADSALASAGPTPPGRLALMPELATRLGWGLVLQLWPLSDAETAEALARTLAERGVAASADLIPWLMARSRRDLGGLRALIDGLDRYALERKRAITVPLLREFLQARLPLEPAAPGNPPGHLP